MFGFFLATFLGAAVVLIGLTDRTRTGRKVLVVLMVGYAVRLGLQTFLRDVPFFSHGVGGDNLQYEYEGTLIARIWQASGVHYVTADEFPELGPTSLPGNIFALVTFLNDGEVTRLGCTSVVAFAACMTTLNLYRLAVHIGASERASFYVMTLVLFSPSFLFHTSEMFKDGIVAFCVTGALAAAVRLSTKLSVTHALYGAGCLVALWFVRHYLVYAAIIPFAAGAVGLSPKRLGRGLVVGLSLLTVVVAIGAYSAVLNDLTERAEVTMMSGTSVEWREANAQGGSGVDLGESKASLVPKLAYTIFSPFPWQGGSIGFQIGKIESLLWYYLMWHAAAGGRRLARERGLYLGIFLAFIVPTSIVYAQSFSNIGLIVRQRMPIVLVTGVLSAIGLAEREAERERRRLSRVPLRRARAEAV
jgi:hypothetical protein